MKRLLIAISILLIASLSLNLILIFTGSKEDSQPAATEGVRLDRQEMASERLRKRSTVEDRVSLEKAVQEQGKAELDFLRELAVKEAAAKTIEAIDRLLASKDEQLEQIVSKIEERASRERSNLEQGRRGLQERVERRRPDREDEKTQEDIPGD
jgi:hypothetical protein